jgi:hypothetical protein
MTRILRGRRYADFKRYTGYTPAAVYLLFADRIGVGVPAKIEELEMVLECTPGISLPAGVSSTEYIQQLAKDGYFHACPEGDRVENQIFILLSKAKKKS